MSDHIIPLSQAVAMTSKYREQKENILDEPFRNLEILPICETFSKEQVLNMLNNENCISMRIYYGMDDADKIHAILVGADADGNDILPPGDTAEDNNGELLEDGTRCPNICPPPSPLNA